MCTTLDRPGRALEDLTPVQGTKDTAQRSLPNLVAELRTVRDESGRGFGAVLAGVAPQLTSVE